MHYCCLRIHDRYMCIKHRRSFISLKFGKYGDCDTQFNHDELVLTHFSLSIYKKDYTTL